jgi:hypothetical protein
VTGTHLEDVQHTIHKLKLNEVLDRVLLKHGNYIDPFNAQRVQQFERYINYPSNPVFKFFKKLGSNSNLNDCYGAQIYEG